MPCHTAVLALAGVLFREDWKETPPAAPVTQEHVSNPDLLLTRHGPGRDGIRKSHHDTPADDPYYVWSGEAEGNWALTLRPRAGPVDLSGARIRWRAKQSGFRQLRIVIGLADRMWLVSDQHDDESADWRVREFRLDELRWRALDIEKVVEGGWVTAPDLRRVVEVGFTDLMRGGRSAACSRVDWIEVLSAEPNTRPRHR
jgi:hypothetical protein